MIANRLRGILHSSGRQDYSAATWSPTDITNITLSNSNKTAQSNWLNHYSLVRSNLEITGSIYVEVTANPFADYTAGGAVGLKLSTDAFSNTMPSTGNGLLQISGSMLTNYVYGISFNPATGAYVIRTNNTISTSGTLTPSIYWRICAWMGESYTGTNGTATINTGASPFVYTPVYI